MLHPKLRVVVVVEWRVSPRLDMRLRHVLEMTKVWFLDIYKVYYLRLAFSLTAGSELLFHKHGINNNKVVIYRVKVGYRL